MATASTQLPTTRPTAPLPAPAVEALARLELAFAPLPVVKAVTRYEVASARTAELSHASDSRTLTVAEFDVLAAAQETMREQIAVLTAAGRLDLIGGAS